MYTKNQDKNTIDNSTEQGEDHQCFNAIFSFLINKKGIITHYFHHLPFFYRNKKMIIIRKIFPNIFAVLSF